MIEINNLLKKFGDFTALDSISFKVESGSIFGLIGSNGAGKSTLLRTVCGVYKPDGGFVRVDGMETFENTDIKDDIFFISDFPYFLPQTTISEMALIYQSIYKKWDKLTFERLCTVFPLDRKQKIHNMSKGMQRQAALILALSTKPRVLLLDEIFDGLDPVIRQLLKQIISDEVINSNLTVVIASHNLRELEDFCDHIGLLHKGGILFEQEIDSLKLGIHKVQAAFRPMPSADEFEKFDIIKKETRGSLVTFVARGTHDELLSKLNEMNPIFSEIIPLSLEEVFISEMEAAGYDLDNIIG